MDRETREVAQAKVRISRELAARRGPDAPLRRQVRDPKDTLSAFTVLRRHFSGR